jgi:hypothetical protein
VKSCLATARSKGLIRGVGLVFGAAGALVLVGASPSHGQIQRTVGFHIGRVRAQQHWEGPFSTSQANGLAVGVNVDVPTPVRYLGVRAELGYLRRGSVVWDDALDPDREHPANVRSHYLSVPIQGKLDLRLGPGALYLVAGPTFDLLLETQCSQDLCRLLYDEHPMVFSLTLGAGASFDVRDTLRGEFEGRITEGLTDAYSSNSVSVQYRSIELLVRACIPF